MPSDKRARQRAMREIKLAEQERRAHRMKQLRRVLGALLVVGVVIGAVVLLSQSSKPKKPTASHPTTTLSPTSTTQIGTPTTAVVSKTPVVPTCPPTTVAGAPKRVIAFTKAPPMCISPTAIFDARFTTDLGTFVVRMPAAASPVAVNNFVFLARNHFYDGVVFHRVIPAFVVQGGDPTGTGFGGAGYNYTGNTPPTSCAAKKDCYPTGTFALGNSNSSPTTDGSQFFIVLPGGEPLLEPVAHTNPAYTRLGQVIGGMSVVDAIGKDGSLTGKPAVLHYMKKVTITQVAG